jgi:hypothetical protein
MGATNSIHNGVSNNIYVSYDFREKNNHYIGRLIDELRNENYNIIYSDITSESLKLLSVKEISLTMENIMRQSSWIIMCVSESTIRSFYQAIEINTALDTNTKIIYLMLDKSYTPHTNEFVKGFVKQNKWYPFYTGEHVSDCIDILDKNTHK